VLIVETGGIRNLIFAFNVWGIVVLRLCFVVTLRLFLKALQVHCLNLPNQFRPMDMFSVFVSRYPNDIYYYWFWNKMIINIPFQCAPLTLLVPVFGILGGDWFYDGKPLARSQN